MSKVVVLDPGHGVDTPGKRSPDGTLREYEFNGDVAARAAKLLQARGVKVILTRPCTKDARDVSLAKRVQIANAAKADLFISIHANAVGTGGSWLGAKGYEVYVYRLGGEAYRLAERLVEEAQRLIAPMGIPLRIPPIKREDFYVLRRTVMPAVLIEHGFMTHPEECQILKSDAFRQKAAEHIARAVCRYLGVAWSEPVLRRGSTGAAVRELQEKLKQLGHDPGPVDGVFGPRTEAAVRAFQKAARIAVDGVVGPQTWGAIEAALRARQESKPAPEPKPEPKPAPKPQEAPKPEPEPKPGPFRDVPATDPDADVFARLKQAGIVQGYPDGTVRPEEPITMRRLAKMLDRVLQGQG